MKTKCEVSSTLNVSFSLISRLNTLIQLNSCLLHFFISICTVNNRHIFLKERIILQSNIVKWLHFPSRNLFLCFEKIYMFINEFYRTILTSKIFFITIVKNIFPLSHLYAYFLFLTQIICHLIF